MFANIRFFAALYLVLGLQVLALRITSPGRDAQWKKGNRETVSWEVSLPAQLRQAATAILTRARC